MSSKNVEDLKRHSGHLRGSIGEELTNAEAFFGEEALTLLKFHGVYQQDDRDLRTERRKAKLDKAWSMMVRTKIPGGEISPERYLEMEKIGDTFGNGTIRLTSRQDIQFHGILKGELRDAIQAMNQAGITTSGACGDIVRNVMATSIPVRNAVFETCRRLSHELSEVFLSRSSAYTEIWIDGVNITPALNGNGAANGAAEEEPLYGEVYLPRKFKIGIVAELRNDVDVFTNDLGFIAHAGPDGKVEGYTVVAGGGFGMTHGKSETFPALARPLCYVKPEQAAAIAKAVVIVQRDNGNREDRKQARLKYLIYKQGIEWFREQVYAVAGFRAEAPRPVRFETVGDMLGWSEQGDGKWAYGLRIECGRLKDDETTRIKSCVRELVEKFGRPMLITPNSNLIFLDLEASQKAAVDAIVNDFGALPAEKWTEAGKTSLVCVALPTCGLALTDSERVFPKLMERIDGLLEEFGMAHEPLLVRMTGCPNGCTRPYNADFAFVGKSPGKYAMYVGGSIAGDRMARLVGKIVDFEEIVDRMRPYLEEYRRERRDDDRFSDYYARTHDNADWTPEQFHEVTVEAAT